MPFKLNDRVYCGRNSKWGIVLYNGDINDTYYVMYANDDAPFHIERACDLVLQIINYPIFDINQRVYNAELKMSGVIREIKDLDDYGLFSYFILYDNNCYGTVKSCDIMFLSNILTNV